MKHLALSVLVVALLAACKSTPVTQPSKAAVEERGPAAAAPKGPATQAAPQQPVAASPLKDPANILSKRSVYFDFDSSAVKDEFRSLLQAHSKYLVDNNNTRITVQGNADERGSREYNLALGQRRADSVRRVMNVLGVPDRQIDTVSFGEEKPRCAVHNEDCWAQNRRADIVYPGE